MLGVPGVGLAKTGVPGVGLAKTGVPGVVTTRFAARMKTGGVAIGLGVSAMRI